MTRLQISSLAVIGAITTFLSARAPAAQPSDVAPASPAKEFACGAKENPCPMQKWMKDNMANASDGPSLNKALTTVAGKNPDPSFTEWSKIAKGGADLAAKGDVDGAKKSCKSCHDLYKKKYKDEMRDKAF
ncbi:MAG TPA: hypothetical protein VJT73_16100 [Polyangiaceae bacterium]|nr:hypothetical protein [Polyangiaceae bacterium]